MSLIIIPAIDLREGRCVRLTQGRKDKPTVYVGDPVEIALSFEASGAQLIHVVDLDGAFSDPNSQNRQVLRRIVSQTKVPLQFGGGLRTLDDVAQVIEFGVARVVIGTLAVEAPKTLAQAVALFGARIAVGVDAKDGQVLIHGWEKDGQLSALELGRKAASIGVERIIYTDTARDGMLSGLNVEQTCIIARESGLKITASGGISSLEDIELLMNASCFAGPGRIDSLIIGKALYEGCFTFEEALRVTSRGGAPTSKSPRGV